MASIIGRFKVDTSGCPHVYGYKQLGPYPTGSPFLFHSECRIAVDKFRAEIGPPNRLVVTQRELEMLDHVARMTTPRESSNKIFGVLLRVSSYPSRAKILEAVAQLRVYARWARASDQLVREGVVHNPCYGFGEME